MCFAKSVKDGLKAAGLGRLSVLARLLRKSYYFAVDAVGYMIFLPLKIFTSKELPKEAVKNILLIRLDRLGDVVLTTPAIRAVRRTYPKAKVHLLVAGYTRDLVVNDPDVDKVLVYKKDKLEKDYDLAIAFHPGFKQNYIAYSCGAKTRIGYTGWGGGFFLTRKLKDDRARRVRHEVVSALEVADLAGCNTGDVSLHVSVTDSGEGFAQEFFGLNGLSGAPVIAIHPGARQDYIRWPKEGFAKVADRLIKDHGVKVILIGSESERGLVEAVASLMEEKPVFAVGLSLTGLVSVIKRCALFIGNSTGPMHIAAGSGVPVVAIFGPAHPLDSFKEWGPWSRNNIVVNKVLNCPHCHPSECGGFECMKLVTSKDVLAAARVLLKI